MYECYLVAKYLSIVSCLKIKNSKKFGSSSSFIERDLSKTVYQQIFVCKFKVLRLIKLTNILIFQIREEMGQNLSSENTLTKVYNFVFKFFKVVLLCKCFKRFKRRDLGPFLAKFVNICLTESCATC